MKTKICALFKIIHTVHLFILFSWRSIIEKIFQARSFYTNAIQSKIKIIFHNYYHVGIIAHLNNNNHEDSKHDSSQSPVLYNEAYSSNLLRSTLKTISIWLNTNTWTKFRNEQTSNNKHWFKKQALLNKKIQYLRRCIQYRGKCKVLEELQRF